MYVCNAVITHKTPHIFVLFFWQIPLLTQEKENNAKILTLT